MEIILPRTGFPETSNISPSYVISQKRHLYNTDCDLSLTFHAYFQDSAPLYQLFSKTGKNHAFWAKHQIS